MKPELLTSSSSHVLFHYSCSNTLPNVALGTIIIIPDVSYKVTIDPRSQLNLLPRQRQPRLPVTILHPWRRRAFHVSRERSLMEIVGFLWRFPWWKDVVFEVFGCRGGWSFEVYGPIFFKCLCHFGFHGVDTEIRFSDCCWRCVPDDFCLPYVEECDLQAGSSFISEVQ